MRFVRAWPVPWRCAVTRCDPPTIDAVSLRALDRLEALERRFPKSGVHKRAFDGPTEGLIYELLDAERCQCDRCVDLRCLSLKVRRFGDEDHLDGRVVGHDDKLRSAPKGRF